MSTGSKERLLSKIAKIEKKLAERGAVVNAIQACVVSDLQCELEILQYSLAALKNNKQGEL